MTGTLHHTENVTEPKKSRRKTASCCFTAGSDPVDCMMCSGISPDEIRPLSSSLGVPPSYDGIRRSASYDAYRFVSAPPACTRSNSRRILFSLSVRFFGTPIRTVTY